MMRCRAGNEEERPSHASAVTLPPLQARLVEFFFTVACACLISPRYKRLLCLSSLFLAFGAQAVLAGGNYPLGVMSAVLSFSSIVYHATHEPSVRAVDILMLYSVGALGLTEALINSIKHGPNFGWIATPICVFALVVILVWPIFHEHRQGIDVIQLQWHFMLHFFGGAGLYFIAMGDATFAQGKGGWGVPPPLTPFRWEAWLSAAAALALLVLLSSSIYKRAVAEATRI